MEREQQLKSEWWGRILISREPCGSCVLKNKQTRPHSCTAHHGFRVKAADAHSSSHPPFASPSVCMLLTPPRVKRTHRTSALYDRRWAGERDRKRCPNLTLLLAESYKPLPNGWHPKTSQTLKIRKNNMLVGDSGCLRCISMQKGHVTPFCPL